MRKMRSASPLFRLFVNVVLTGLVLLLLFLKGLKDHGYWVAGGIALVVFLAA